MLKQCPACESNMGLKITTRLKEFDIKGEKITIDTTYYHCNNCGKDFNSPKEFGDPYRKAYDEYRRRKGMVQPEEIVSFRNKYNLTQKELSDLLGFGGVTLSRYENGALQDQAHDSILRLAMEPQNLLRLVTQNTFKIASPKWTKLLAQLETELTLVDKMELFLGKNEPSEYNGFKSLDLIKVVEVIKFFCFNREVYKTKLLKLFFYSDFLHYKQTNRSITGMKYAHLPYGPVPNGYDLIFGAIMQIEPGFHLEPRDFGDYGGEVIVIEKSPDTSTFSQTELDVLKKVSNQFAFYSSKAISIKSHKENGYIATKTSELISYNFANEIDLNA